MQVGQVNLNGKRGEKDRRTRGTFLSSHKTSRFLDSAAGEDEDSQHGVCET